MKIPAPIFFAFVVPALALLFPAFADDPAPAPPDPLVEVISGGTPETSVYVKKSDLAKIKLETPVVVSPQLTVTHAGVGKLEIDRKTRSMLFIPTTEVPLRTGASFGWLVKASTTLDQVTVAETFTLPKQNGTWSVDASRTTISDDGLSATTTYPQSIWDMVWNLWTFEDGDPDGPHAFELKIEDKPVATLKFDIVKPKR